MSTADDKYQQAINNIFGTKGQSPWEPRPDAPNIPNRTYVPIVRRQASYPRHFEAQSAHDLGGMVDEITWLVQDALTALDKGDYEKVREEIIGLMCLNESIDNIYLDNIWCARYRKRGE